MQFQKVPSFWLVYQHFVHRQEHLLRRQFWSEVAQLLDGTRRLRPPGRQHTLPVSPRDAIGWTDLLIRQRRLDGSV